MNERVAVVTGATGGIGRAVTLRLARDGWRVFATDRNEEKLNALSEDAVDKGIQVAELDVSNFISVAEFFRNFRTESERLDLLFNNAGVFGHERPIDEVDDEEWSEVIRINLTGAFLCAREAFRIMKTQEPSGGRIINIGSLASHVPRPQSVAYTASKHAVVGLTKAIALEGRAYSIACSQIDIGNAGTKMGNRVANSALQANGSVTPEPTFDVVHVAETVSLLANLPLDVNVLTLTIMASGMPFVGRG